MIFIRPVKKYPLTKTMALSFKLRLLFLIGTSLPIFTSSQEIGNNGIIFHYNNTYRYNEVYKVLVNKQTEYIMEFGGGTESYDTPARVTVASDSANRTYPLFITARQQKGVFSWQLPMLVQTPTGLDQFTNISRTLCPHNNLFDEQTDTCDISKQNTPIIHLTSSSPNDIEVTILVETVDDFYIKLNRTTNFTITTSQPKYYFFPFKQPGGLDAAVAKRKQVCNEQLDDRQRRLMSVYREEGDAWFWKPKSVILMIESDDDICAVVSIQNFSCPVFDNERDILYDGYYLTMTRRGGITLTQDTFPVGFYIVFIVKNSDEDCSGNSTTTLLPRVKNFSFQIVSTISYVEYLVAAGAALSLFLCFYVAFFATILFQRKWRTTDVITEVTDEQCIIATSPPHDETNVTIVRRRNINTVESTQSTSRGEGDGHSDTSTTDTDTESDFSTLDDINTEKDIYRLPTRLRVSALSRARPRVLSARSRMYTWHLLTVAVFYTLPVVQLVITYQRLLNQSGNQDLCYFNFFCAHPLLVLSDFNHVFSNLGYVLLGALFVLQVWRRQRWHQSRPAFEKELGIPQHFGLLYAMGIALISEGILSAAYHVCPNSMNFQFDTSFMYVTGVLCMVKVYQSRHPDINARAHATFPVLALIIFIGLVGVLNANLYFWVAFTILHLTTCLILTFQIYYMGRFKLDGGMIYRAARELASRPLAAITPTYCARCVLLALANIANWALAAYGVSQHGRDFASHLLLVLMANLFLYTLFYIAMKLLHREKIAWYSWVFIVLTYGTWFSSSYFYLDQSTNWALTPAESRRNNRVCSLLQLYDSHDIWHFMSSIAMFFSFSMYLTIDDNIANVPRSNIMVF